MSYAPMVAVDSTGKFYGNALRFATQDEAKSYALDLSSRWTLVHATRVDESEDPVNYYWDSRQGAVRLPEEVK